MNRFSFRFWKKWVGFRWSNYEYHSGESKQWSGFHLYLGWFLIAYSIPRHKLEAV